LDRVRLSPQGAVLSGAVGRGVGDLELPGSGESIDPDLQEKLPDGCRERPYRKPTRVAGCESTKVDG